MSDGPIEGIHVFTATDAYDEDRGYFDTPSWIKDMEKKSKLCGTYAPINRFKMTKRSASLRLTVFKTFARKDIDYVIYEHNDHICVMELERFLGIWEKVNE